MRNPSNKICPRCGKAGYVNYIGQSNIYEAKCYNCGYYFVFGALDLYEEKTPQTNADRIRSMSDEELAGILAMPSIISPPWCSEKYDCPYADQDPVRCDLCALDWLKEETKE